MNLVPYGRAHLPKTAVEPGGPVSNEALEFIITSFVWPVLQVFNGGQATSKAEMKGLLLIYAREVVGFEAEAYEPAGRKMIRERTDRFRPVPAECRQIIQSAHDQLPQVIAQRRLEAARGAAAELLSTYPKGWRGDRVALVRALPDGEQHDFWRRSLRQLKDHSGYVGDEPEDTSLTWRMTQWWGMRSLLDKPPCIIPAGILREFGLPTTHSEIATVKAEIESAKASVARA